MTTAAIQFINANKKLIVDFGGGVGNQGVLLAKSHKASSLLSIENPKNHPMLKYKFWNEWKDIQKNISGNTSTNMIEYDLAELTSPELQNITQEQFIEQPSIAIANIGPHYSDVHKNVLDVITRTPSFETVLLGGYVAPINGIQTNPKLNPIEHMQCLWEKGFTNITIYTARNGICSILAQKPSNSSQQ